LEQPKKPVGGAYGVFMAEKRPEYLKSLAGKPVSEVSKMAGEAWGKLSEKQKEPYQKQYEEKKAQFDKDMAAFLEAGGEKTKGVTALRAERRKAKEGKKKKDVNAPKKPAGGGYGVYLAENRAAIVKSLPEGHKITDVSKAASTKWNALSDAEKKPFNDKYLKNMEEYKVAFEEYKKNLPEDAEDDEEDGDAEEEQEEAESPPKKGGKTGAKNDEAKKRKPAEKENQSPAPKKAKVGKAGKPAEPVIDADVLKKAQNLGLESSLKNLMARPEVSAQGLPHAKLLGELEKADGLVNKAKRALLGGA